LGAPSQIRRRRILSSFGAIGGASWKSSFGWSILGYGLWHPGIPWKPKVLGSTYEIQHQTIWVCTPDCHQDCPSNSAANWPGPRVFSVTT
jgi:hypothetical protein